MLNGDVLHSFQPQSELWDDLWLEQDGQGLRVFADFHRANERSEADKAVVNETRLFFMRANEVEQA
jgi:hypothetical protein